MAYLAGICRNEKIFVHEIGGMEDHVHMLIQLPPTIALADAVQEIKASSSKWLGKRFAWQRGYGAFSVCRSTLDRVARYIRNQEAHHRGEITSRNSSRCWTNTACNTMWRIYSGNGLCRTAGGEPVSRLEGACIHFSRVPTASPWATCWRA